MDRPSERTSNEKGASHPTTPLPNTAAIKAAIKRYYFVVCQRLYRFDSISCFPRLRSDLRLLKKWWIEPRGQIHPQKKRPRNIVGIRTTRLHNRPWYRARLESAFDSATSGSNRKNNCTG